MTDTATLIHKWKLPIAQGEAREAWAGWIDESDFLDAIREELDEGWPEYE